MPESPVPNLPEGIEGAPYNQQLGARGGAGHYVWAVVPGTGRLPQGLHLRPDGTITGVPVVAGARTFTVEVRSGTRTARLAMRLDIKPRLTVRTSEIGAGIEGASYRTALQARGGEGRHTWAVAEGEGGLPPGLSLSPDGVISGIPSESGTWSFTVEVACARRVTEVTVSRFTVEVARAPDKARRGLSITVHEGLSIPPTSLPDAVEGVVFHERLEARGGDGGHSWSLARGSGPLPTGLHLSPDGLLSGAPATAGTSSCTFQVTSGAQAARVELVVRVRARLAIETTSLPEGIEGAPYRTRVDARGDGDVCVWSLAPDSHDLPSGLSLSPNGVIAGVPETAGTSRFTVEASDGVRTVRQSLWIAVSPRLAVATAALATGTEGVRYDERLKATGGTERHVWALAPGSPPLPAGLTLSADGVLSGTPKAVGATSVGVTVTSGRQTAHRTVSISVSPQLAVPSQELPEAVLGAAYRHGLTAVGGTGRYGWRLAPESAPIAAGLRLSPEGTISGTPESAGRRRFTVEVTSEGQLARQTLTLDVRAKLDMRSSSAPLATQGVIYHHVLEADGGDGRYAWALASGSEGLPPGLSLSSQGVIRGTPEGAGRSSVTVEVTSGEQTARGTLTLAVRPRLSVEARELPQGTEGKPYRYRLVAAGSEVAPTWGAASGRLPPGLSLSPEGEIIGTTTAAGNWDFTVRVTSGEQRLHVPLSIAVSVPKARSAALTVRPSFRRLAVVAGSFAVAALAWTAVARALFPRVEPSGWYRAFAGARVGFYAEQYPSLRAIFGLLAPMLVIAAGLRLWINHAAPRLAGVRLGRQVVTPAWIRPGSDEREPEGLGRPRARLRRATAAALGAAAFLQLLYALAAWGVGDRIALVLGVVACILAARVWRSASVFELLVLGLFGAAQAVILVGILGAAPLPYAHRAMLVATTAAYLSLPILLLGLATPLPAATAFIRVAASVSVAALLAEAVATLVVAAQGGMPEAPTVAATSDPRAVIRERGPRQPHPELGSIPVPNSVTETIYPDDPRGYFQVRHTAPWRFSTQPSSDAQMRRTNDGVAVLIDRADDPTPWHVYLARYGVRLEQGTQYALRFRARATRARPVGFGISMAHPPGEGLGLVGTETVTAEWTPITRVFTARLSEDSARVDFRLGGDTADVSLADVSVTRVADEARVDGGSGIEPFVTYEWNSRGCRAREHVVPPAPGVSRILVLGDSYTMGWGVRAGDVFTAILERRLERGRADAPAPTRVEVVNCGVSGFSTREERIFYEERVRVYEPSLVLVVMVPDDAGGHQAQEPTVSETPARWEYLFHAVHLVQARRRDGRDFSRAMEELAELGEVVRGDGAELGVVVFPNAQERASEGLSASASATASRLGAPFLDLRDALLAQGGGQELRVHPLDAHPNEIAHRIAGERIAEWLEGQGLVGVAARTTSSP